MRTGAGPPDPYRKAIERLYGLERGKGALGLDGTRLLLDALGHPERGFLAVHVAGTNGKGSTCALLERCLRAAGLSTGLFTSPHLLDYRERVRVNGTAAPREAIERALARIESLPASAGRTFFEVTFALGCLHFAASGVEVAVLETGLGGRLDSTNVVEPALCVLTPIALDHMDMLGPTLEAIAGEKAGILKPGVPALAAAQEPAALSVLIARAREVNAPLAKVEDSARVVRVHTLDRTGTDVTLAVAPWGELRVRLGLLGHHQIANAVTAAAAFAALAPGIGPPAHARGIGSPALAEGLSRARWPGRFEASAREPRLFWDGAHNGSGARAAREAWRDVLGDPPGALVLGLSEDKDPAAVLGALEGPWRRVHAVAADSPRARSAADVTRLVRSAWPGVPVTECGAVADGVRSALTSLATGELAFATGSLFVVGEAMAATGEDALECL